MGIPQGTTSAHAQPPLARYKAKPFWAGYFQKAFMPLYACERSLYEEIA